MTPAPSAGGEEKRKKSRRRRPRRKKSASAIAQNNSEPTSSRNQGAKRKTNRPTRYAKRVDEVSAGGLVVDSTGTRGLLIARRDQKDQTRLIWSLPKGHIEEGETPELAALREVAEETGITSEIARSLGVIDFWFMASGKRIHKTVHHFLFKEVGGSLKPQVTEVDDVAWIPLEEIVAKLAYPDEKKLIARSGDLTP
ncbi:MAG: NUDIX hydrolase [Actinobacteria bacterium]|nr:NUDIX hydrolase [Actinomycetota bacterium]